MCEKAHALRLQFEFEKSRWLAKIRENESESMFSRDTRSFPPAVERKKPYYTTDAIPEERNNTGESDEQNHQDMQNGHSNILTSENKQFTYDTSDEMLSIDQFDQDSLGVTQNLAVTMSDDDAADQNSKRKRKFTTPSKSTVSADTSRPMESVTINTGIDVPVVTKNSMIDDIEQEQWQIDDNSGADFGATHYYEYQQAAQNEEFGSSAESAFPLTADKTSFESVDVGLKYDADQMNNVHYDFETTDCDRELSGGANVSQEFQDEYVRKNDDELLTLNMFVAGSPQRNYTKDSLAESGEIHLTESSNHRKNRNNQNVATKYESINKHGVGREATQAGGNDTSVGGAHCSSQTGMQIDSLHLSSQSADTDTAAATMINGVDECRGDITATQTGDNDTPADGAYGSSQTGMQIDSRYSSSQSANTDTAAVHILDDHMTTASASIFSSIDPIGFIDNDSLAVDILLPP